MFLYCFNYLVARNLTSLLYESNVVTNSELVLQVVATTAADQLATCHNPDPISEIVGLVHEMSCH